MTSNSFFLDSNVILYLFDSNNEKRERAIELMALVPVINSQVLAEVGNICRKKLGFSKDETLNLWADLLEDCNVFPVDAQTFHEAILLVAKFQFQIFDSLIVASALQSGCAILYSEDMQHNLNIEGRLTIINPFK
ncbi:PIN domain-containing protein [Pedobacter sp. SYSU D00535]|uniref:PIN domain-containing protein n=1 Tax=Pedobacter sp. SYSU D00535 TaxID=2810308 RepID=UPI001A95C7F4|nr:PIN domain-containing protein [Pedobacter sp. SYSU D00535]